MNRHARGTRSDEGSGRGGLWLKAAIFAALAVAAGGWYVFRAGRTARLANHTIALQERLLATSTDPKERRRAIDEIRRSVDLLPPAEVRRVRNDFLKRIDVLRRQSLDRFVDASPDERTSLLDEDLDRIRLVSGIMDATEQGGMPQVTEAELVERAAQQQKQAEKQAAKAAKAEAKQAPAKPAARPPTDEQKQAKEYIEALTKRAKEKKVDLGRMFSRPPGRG